MQRTSIFAATVATLIGCATAAFAQQNARTPPETAITGWQLVGAPVAVAIASGALWLGARNSTLLRDNLLPQIAPRQQPYSLGRWQMAFWFLLIFASFIAIYVTTWRYNGVITSQELWLMGISATSGVAAVAVDVVKDSLADAANRGLKALGFTTYADVERTRAEITQLQAQLPGADPATVALLATQIRNKQLLLTAYEDKIKPFVSEGWYKDITTDANGAALHRVQALAWTLALGVIFVATVIYSIRLREPGMPQFDSSLLLLLGISNAGYVGFKYPEQGQ
jgi:hypothetical protein